MALSHLFPAPYYIGMFVTITINIFKIQLKI